MPVVGYREGDAFVSDGLGQLAGWYAEHGGALLAYLHRWFGHAEAAEDLLQETMLQAARHAPDVRPLSPRAWLFGIARHVGLSALRRHRATAPLPVDWPAQPPPQDARVERVRRALTGLPDAQRETLELRVGHGLSYQEIAETLQVPVGTVRSRLHYAIRELREILVESDAVES